MEEAVEQRRTTVQLCSGWLGETFSVVSSMSTPRGSLPSLHHLQQGWHEWFDEFRVHGADPLEERANNTLS
ncbi:hypothetical protein Y1Q_0016654 [Alligator mississippiensis]|uniref:Uncharacterized protein n=1 Tax=Alligator mississippiensis TaxID=8496 RepID=A0A151P1C0_ALLMI|nr:hypothetical protein Y1Q_0016654 [Alligator mississippiensis]